jgi:hypothetical protein
MFPPKAIDQCVLSITSGTVRRMADKQRSASSSQQIDCTHQTIEAAGKQADVIMVGAGAWSRRRESLKRAGP